MPESEAYECTPRNTVNRLKQRATYDYETVHSIINSAPVVHVSFNPTSFEDDPFPTILPMLGCTGSFTPPEASETSATAVYLHGHSASRFMKLPSSPNSPHAVEGLPGVPVCVAATQMDGLVLALTPFNHSCNYRSAVVHGYAHAVTDPEEKNYALELITDSIIPSRWENSRVPPTPAEIASTGVLRVDIVSASAKIRAYGAGNDKADLADEEMRKRVWTGVVPAYIRYGEPVPADENLVGEVPGYVGGWIKEQNEVGEKYSREVTKFKAPKKT
ncbi:hypothetical protein GALMADRAFT_63627 [Galerina marginata CBS 339.88]|uniref:Flavin-nucleotide-binding protein n=1 Tax=Galerina marginata (strain CBS 339.88) TaxID=685588 RepID=A0A067T8Y1_GALM3|nr:hypothetical protein GALMADRAFT_63627 [Galerina marginata CBS 339.88]